MSNQVITNFSNGLFELAKENQEVDIFKKQMQEIEIVLTQNPDWINLMSSFSIEDTVKKELIDTVFKKNCHPYIINFLKLVVDKKRFASILQIIQQFVLLSDADAGVMQGVVYTTTKLDATSLKDLEDAFTKKLAKTITLKNKIDVNLIAGARVEIDHQVYDNTLKNKVEQLRKEMLSRE